MLPRLIIGYSTESVRVNKTGTLWSQKLGSIFALFFDFSPVDPDLLRKDRVDRPSSYEPLGMPLIDLVHRPLPAGDYLLSLAEVDRCRRQVRDSRMGVFVVVPREERLRELVRLVQAPEAPSANMIAPPPAIQTRKS